MSTHARLSEPSRQTHCRKGREGKGREGKQWSPIHLPHWSARTSLWITSGARDARPTMDGHFVARFGGRR